MPTRTNCGVCVCACVRSFLATPFSDGQFVTNFSLFYFAPLSSIFSLSSSTYPEHSAAINLVKLLKRNECLRDLVQNVF